VLAAKPADPGGGGGGGKNKGPSCNITAPAPDPVQSNSGDPVDFAATAENGTEPYDIIWSLPGSDQTEVQDSIATSGGSSTVSVSYLADGTYTATFTATDSKGQSCSDTRSVEVGSAPPPPPPTAANYSILAVNDLGMHCADLDYQIFSILPPFNVIHAQVIERGTGDTPETLPKILTNADVDVVYSATSSDLDPAGAGSINTTNDSALLGFDKTNFWQNASSNTLGGLAYRELYPSQDALGLCDASLGPCPSVLDLFEPISVDTGIPVPDPVHLPNLVADQQHMPGITNDPQLFDRFDVDLPFFTSLPFGYTVTSANWFAADGIPILPVDDAGNENPYPLMRVQAISKDCANPDADGHCDATDPDNILASVDIVLPVASEADCQTCHADISDFGNGAAANMASVSFDVQLESGAPGPEPLQNAAKINILRLHDVKHGAGYRSWDNTGAGAQLVATACDAADNPEDASLWNANCLVNKTPVQCSQCHYSPALDLAQVGPVDEPEQGPDGRQQLHHISQSRAMHDHHGKFTALFPEMPGPNDPLRTELAINNYPDATDSLQTVEDYVLEKTCYACHPGKRTQCLRGAMYNGGMRCQDCHGNMAQVGNDFTEDFPNNPGNMDMTKRISWADEPGCQSCHTGDAVNNLAGDHPDVVAGDGIRLLQAYTNTSHPDGSQVAEIIQAPDSRFAENNPLYRLSQGHGGVKCENCHGSTHAIWPVTPREGPFVANDNLAAIQLQGHDGKIQECDVCHERGSDGNLSMPLSLDGPHGMHPVGDNRWNHQHRNFTGGKNANCKGCHGPDLTGTVLSATSADRVLDCKNNQGDFPDCAAGNATVFVPAGTEIGCGNCHKQK
jgi:hypothetical protein